MSREPVAMYGARPADTITGSGPDAPRTKAGHMTAPDQIAKPRQQNSCNAAAVHTWRRRGGGDGAPYSSITSFTIAASSFKLKGFCRKWKFSSPSRFFLNASSA